MTNSNSSISKHYHQLNSVQRGQIQAMLDSGITSRTAILLLLEKLAAISRQSVVKSNVEASYKEIAAICCMSIITPILHRFITKSVAETSAITAMAVIPCTRRDSATLLNSVLKRLKTEKHRCTGKEIWLKVSDARISLL